MRQYRGIFQQGGCLVVRPVFASLLILMTVSAVADAQQWAQKLFSQTEYDFGTLARGSQPEYSFQLTNLYEQEVHISGIRSSCGCTIPEISKHTLKTREKGKIRCRFNTIAHLGHKNAVVTVTFDKPRLAEVQLNIQGFVRRDVVMKPGIAEFGDVTEGESAERKVSVEYAGRGDWKITDVRSTNLNYKVSLQETHRDSERVGYELGIQLKNTAPSGFFNNELTLVSNDPASQPIRLPVQGYVRPSLTVSPKSLSLGDVELGQKVSKQLIVRSKQPFRIVNVNCEDESFRFRKPDMVRKTHILPVTFTALGNPGKVAKRIEIETDLGAGTTVECLATATIKSVLR